jgi:hypothetical protein
VVLPSNPVVVVCRDAVPGAKDAVVFELAVFPLKPVKDLLSVYDPPPQFAVSWNVADLPSTPVTVVTREYPPGSCVTVVVEDCAEAFVVSAMLLADIATATLM